MVSHFQVLILVDLLEMQHLDFLEGGWVLVPCFPFAEGILKLAPLTMYLGLLGKRLVHLCVYKINILVVSNLLYVGHLSKF